jgi:O-antigen/teichoic acid export membrane protein
VTIFQKLAGIWEEDHLLRRVVKNSSYLFSSNVISAILGLVQTVIAVRLIGLTSWGLVAIIQTFSSNINRFLSFRMSEVVLKHLGPALAADKKEEAAMYVKAAGLMEAITSMAAFLILLLLAPWASRTFARDVNLAPLFIFYGLILLSNLVFETSTGVLQATNRFSHLGVANLIQTIITLVLTSLTYVLFRWGKIIPMSSLVIALLAAYVAGKTYYAMSYLFTAWRELNSNLGAGWWRVSLRGLPNKRSLAAFAINTNLNGTVNLVFRDNIQLYLGALLDLTAVGYFKIAMTFIIPITMVLDPFIAPTYAEISRTIARFEWKATLRLLKRITAIGSAVVLTYWAAWAAVGWWIIPILYKPQARPVYPVLLILIAGYGFASVFQWNRSLFLSLGKAGYPILISTLIGVIELALLSYLVPGHGSFMMAAILSGYFIISVGLITLRGLWEVRRRQMLAGDQP